MLRLNARDKGRGFTLAEQLIMIAVIGVLLLIAVPSFLSMFDRVTLDQAITDVRGALQESQRQAIRLSQACVVDLDFSGGRVTGSCLTTGDRTLSQRVEIVTNIKPTVGTLNSFQPSKEEKNEGTGNDKTGVQLRFGVLGTAEFSVASAEGSADPSGKIVFYLPETGIKDRKCIAISNTLGLTRVGVYSGALEKSKDVSKGICTASQ